MAASTHLKATVACDFDVPSLNDERKEQAETSSEPDELDILTARQEDFKIRSSSCIKSVEVIKL